MSKFNVDVNSMVIEPFYDDILLQNSIKKYETPYVYDDLVGKQNLIPLYSSNNCLMATLSPIDLHERLKNRSNADDSSPRRLEQMSQVQLEDNYILVVMPVRNATGLK